VLLPAPLRPVVALMDTGHSRSSLVHPSVISGRAYHGLDTAW